MKTNKKDVRKLYNERSAKSIKYAIDAIQSSDLHKYVSAVYLYGSCARGEQKYNSDVDLLIQMNDDFEVEKNHSKLLILKSLIMPDDFRMPEVDAKITVGEKWKNSNEMFYKNIRKEGKLIWQRETI